MSEQSQVSGLRELNQYVNALKGYVQHPSRTFARAAVIMLDDVNRHFRDEAGPCGPWEPLKLETLKARWRDKHGGKSILVGKGSRSRAGAVKFFGSALILQVSGDLRNSNSMAHSDKSAEVGTNKVYAPPHQYGSAKQGIPKRTFLFMSPDACQRCLDLFVADMKDIQ